MKKLLAIDVGGTKIEVCHFSSDFELIKKRIYNTADFSVGKKAMLEELKGVIFYHLDSSICKIGISFNCVIKRGVIVYSSLLGGRMDYDVEGEFLKEFNLPVKIMNDVNAMALAESVFGKGSDVESFVLLNLGTGVRPSFVVGGSVIDGFGGNCGEVSQKKIVVPELGNISIKRDDLLAGNGLANIYSNLTKKELSAKEIFTLCDKGDSFAIKAVNILIKYLADFLEDLNYFYNPQRIIINGSLKKSAKLFLPQVEKLFREDTLEIFHFKDMVISDIDHGACLGVIN